MATTKSKGDKAGKAAAKKAPAKAGRRAGAAPEADGKPADRPATPPAGPPQDGVRTDPRADSPEARRAAGEADDAAKKAGLPPAASLPPQPKGGVRMNDVAMAGGVTFQLPQPAPGRFAAPDAAAELEPGDEKAVTERAKEILKDKDRVPAGRPEERAVAARSMAVTEVLAEKHLDGLSDRKAKEQEETTKEEAQQKEKLRTVREQVYRGADFVNNSRAYAKDPANPADQGPAEPIPVDYRRIQDEEGRLAGNFKAAV